MKEFTTEEKERFEAEHKERKAVENAYEKGIMCPSRKEINRAIKDTLGEFYVRMNKETGTVSLLNKACIAAFVYNHGSLESQAILRRAMWVLSRDGKFSD